MPTTQFDSLGALGYCDSPGAAGQRPAAHCDSPLLDEHELIEETLNALPAPTRAQYHRFLSETQLIAKAQIALGLIDSMAVYENYDDPISIYDLGLEPHLEALIAALATRNTPTTKKYAVLLTEALYPSVSPCLRGDDSVESVESVVSPPCLRGDDSVESVESVVSPPCLRGDDSDDQASLQIFRTFHTLLDRVSPGAAGQRPAAHPDGSTIADLFTLLDLYNTHRTILTLTDEEHLSDKILTLQSQALSALLDSLTETRDQRPGTRGQSPETRDQKPETRDQSPETPAQSPETRGQRESRRPSCRRRQPALPSPLQEAIAMRLLQIPPFGYYTIGYTRERKADPALIARAKQFYATTLLRWQQEITASDSLGAAGQRPAAHPDGPSVKSVDSVVSPCLRGELPTTLLKIRVFEEDLDFPLPGIDYNYCSRTLFTQLIGESPHIKSVKSVESLISSVSPCLRGELQKALIPLRDRGITKI